MHPTKLESALETLIHTTLYYIKSLKKFNVSYTDVYHNIMPTNIARILCTIINLAGKSMVAQNTVSTNGINQEFRFDEGICSHRKSGQIRFFSEKTSFTLYVYNMF